MAIMPLFHSNESWFKSAMPVPRLTAPVMWRAPVTLRRDEAFNAHGPSHDVWLSLQDMPLPRRNIGWWSNEVRDALATLHHDDATR